MIAHDVCYRRYGKIYLMNARRQGEYFYFGCKLAVLTDFTMKKEKSKSEIEFKKQYRFARLYLQNRVRRKPDDYYAIYSLAQREIHKGNDFRSNKLHYLAAKQRIRNNQKRKRK
ncbi:hypothetical protein phi1422_0034 [Bdellovibrio phage phi1422]|uniref:hypothetical protein n=1 Tax=Bdellovibrio phage phi1422 TaxID=1127515 RepID=UPI0002536D56|nr:hypothetical protein F395_gp34 [Bdellovibrio phage phi1422]AFC22554.1 hypothetical protein phi1422_0034 [Bdellovibrio phage phi1422]